MTDPFSIAVGAVGLIGALGATGKAAKKLLKLRKAPHELMQLYNELSDFTITVAKAQEVVKCQKQNDPSDAVVGLLEDLMKRAEAPVNRLRHILGDHIVENFGADIERETDLEFSKRSWFKRQEEARLLRTELLEIRSKIDHACAMHSSTFIPKFYAQFTELLVDQHSIKKSVKAMATQTTRQDALTATASSSHANDGQASAGADVNSALIPGGQPPTSQQSTSSPEVVSGSLQVSTELYMAQTCGKKLCTCRCHSVRRLETAPWASVLVGSLFIGYSGLPLPFTPKIECNQSDCQRNPKSLIKVAWYFPSWWPLAGNVLHFIDQWTPLDGHDITIKLPRVVSPSADIFILAQKGHIDGIKQLIRQGKASVFDISASEGRSALHFALTGQQPDVAAFLIQQRASVEFEDHNALSPIDVLWNYLLEDATLPVHIAFRKAFHSVIDESEDLKKRGFSPLHLIVFGLSKIPLEMALEYDTSHINAKCSLGRTPLCWAALRQDTKPVQILVDKGAALDSADRRGQNALHFAAETGTLASLRSILERADMQECLRRGSHGNDRASCGKCLYSNLSDGVSAVCRGLVESRDSKGRTALHFATRTGRFEHAQLLLLYHAEVDSPDSALGRTPLLIAIYWNHYSIIKLLLDCGAQTKVVDSNGLTVLHYAAKFGDADTLSILSSVSFDGISPEARDAEGLTPSDTFRLIRPGFLKEDAQTLQKAELRFLRLMASTKRARSLASISTSAGSDVFHDAVSSWANSPTASVGSIADLLV